MLSDFSFTQWLWEMYRILLFPLGEGFWNHIALIGVLLFVMLLVSATASKFALAESL